MGDNGDAIIVWQQSASNGVEIFKCEYRNGAWTQPSSILGFNGWPRVAMGNNGDAIIVWDQNVGINRKVFKSEYRNGVWSHPTSISDKINPDGHTAHDPHVSIDKNGNAIVVWYAYDGPLSEQDDDSDSEENKNLYSRVFKSECRNGVWTHPSSISDHISLAGRHAHSQQVATGDNGDAIIVWVQYNDVSSFSNSQIFKCEYRNGAWTHPTGISCISADSFYAANEPQVAMDNNGSTIIVWDQDEIDCVTHQIFKSEYR
jgi:hypothetical protein